MDNSTRRHSDSDGYLDWIAATQLDADKNREPHANGVSHAKHNAAAEPHSIRHTHAFLDSNADPHPNAVQYADSHRLAVGHELAAVHPNAVLHSHGYGDSATESDAVAVPVPDFFGDGYE